MASEAKFVDSDEEGDAKITFFSENAKSKTSVQDDDMVEEDLDKTVEIDFSLFDFKEKDYHAVKTQLSNFPDKLLPMHLMTDSIVGQVEVGATLRAFEQKVGFCTILNLTLFKDQKWLKVFSNFLKQKDDRWAKLLETRMGLLMHFRMINLPQSLGTPVQESLKRDIQWIQTSECAHLNAQQKKSWKLDNVAVLCKRRRVVLDEGVYDEGETTVEEIKAGTAPPPNKKRKTVDFEFMFAEDKIYEKYATVDITFSSEAVCSIPGSDAFHLLIIPFDEWKEAVDEISSNTPDEGLGLT